MRIGAAAISGVALAVACCAGLPAALGAAGVLGTLAVGGIVAAAVALALAVVVIGGQARTRRRTNHPEGGT